MSPLLITIIGGLVTAISTAGLTALLTSYWTAKKNSIHNQYLREAITELKTVQVDHTKRIYAVESNVAILQQARR